MNIASDRGPRVTMLLSNAFAPDPRVGAEAAALARAGADVSVLCWDRDGDLPLVEERGGVHVRRFRLASTHGRGTSQALNMPRIWGRFVDEGAALLPEVVHAHDLDTLPAARRLARRTGAALVFDAHESYPDMLGANVARPLKLACRMLERFLVPRTDLVVTVGERLRRHYADMGAPDSEVVGNWRDPSPDFESDAPTRAIRQALRGRMGVIEPGVFICFIAHLGAERRLAPLLAAVEATPDAWLAVGGVGPSAHDAEEAAARCPRIKRLGPVDPDDVPRWTSACDAVYYGFDPTNANSRFSAPNKLFEALAAGVPVVTARFGEIGEIVAETGCGILVCDYTVEDLAAAFATLADPRRRDELRAAARAAAVRYTRRAADAALVAAYARMGRRLNRAWRVRGPEAA